MQKTVTQQIEDSNWWADGKPALFAKDEDFLQTITDAPFIVEVDRFNAKTQTWDLYWAKAHWTHQLPKIMHALWFGDEIRIRRVK